MPSLRSLIGHTAGDAKTKLKSPKLSPSPDLSKTRQNPDRLDQCRGCENIERLIRRNSEHPKNNLKKTELLHDSFAQLHNCARKCQICRVFRKALLLQEVTFDGEKGLHSLSGEVVVEWEETPAADNVQGNRLKVQIKGHSGRPGVVHCSTQITVAHLALKPQALDPVVVEQAKQWLDTCVNTHVGQCDNLKWSTENPPLLVEILSPGLSVRLRKDQEGQYVALSYCWGNTKALPQAEQDEIERGKTFSTNLDRRLQPFPVTDLPTAVRDALSIIYAMGLRYAWIDTLCIVQDKPEGLATMHKVYSNARFTLCSCATTRATAKLLDQREAWNMRTEPCRLGGKWLTVPDMSLNHLRLKSPLADRAWTLQEERLSPRMLYISSSRMHWSCASSHEMEMKPTYPPNVNLLNREPHPAPDGESDMPPAQDFLLACYTGASDLHEYWADIVKSYALRSMSHLADRLTALSGLAAKYLSASAGDEYLAGIWAKNLANGLAWRLHQAIEVDNEYPSELCKLPSWTWARLPLQTAIETNSRSATSTFFERVVEDTREHAGPGYGADDAIKRGQGVKEIHIIGRTRPFWGPASLQVHWSTVRRVVGGEERFVFATPEQDIHAIQTEQGRILVYEGRKREVVGQLDFSSDVRRLQSGQLDVLVLELGASTMLLLEHDDGAAWRRVGVAWNVRQDYFTSTTRTELILR